MNIIHTETDGPDDTVEIVSTLAFVTKCQVSRLAIYSKRHVGPTLVMDDAKSEAECRIEQVVQSFGTIELGQKLLEMIQRGCSQSTFTGFIGGRVFHACETLERWELQHCGRDDRRTKSP